MTTLETNTIIIGASAAGLAVAAGLKRANSPFILLEQAAQVAPTWRAHYDRLHLHTNKFFSKLPYTPFPANVPRYASRDQVVAYLENYARVNELSPRFGQRVTAVDFVDGKWQTDTADTRYNSKNIVIATGYTHTPVIPHWDGESGFRGQILHSSTYKNGEPYRGKSVLVVGFGNSGGEIAIDLHEHGAQPAISVRSPVNVIRRDTFGIPSLAIGILLNRLPAHVADRLTAPARRITVGDTEALGLGKPAYGPVEQIQKTGRIPLLDIGTIKLIRDGHITVYPDIERFTIEGVRFSNGAASPFDAVILATGYRPNLDSFLKPAAKVTDAKGIPLVSGAESALPGLYFCGYFVSPSGMLRQIAREAKQISGAIMFLGFQYPVEIPGVSNVQFLREALNAQRKLRNEPPLSGAEFLKIARAQADALGLSADMLKRPVNVGFSGGEKKRNEMVQMGILSPKLAILDETDSGLDIDALRVVGDGINRIMRKPDKAVLLITHYQRLLDYVKPDFVHVLSAGRIVRSGGAELAHELEREGYGQTTGELAA